ncbi:hypothetical protein ABZP36_004759, partial [Zizania latifolia]
TKGLSSLVYETLYQINVVERKVTPFNETLWRTWVWSFTGWIAYPMDSRLISWEVAPNNMYNSA